MMAAFSAKGEDGGGVGGAMRYRCSSVMGRVEDNKKQKQNSIHRLDSQAVTLQVKFLDAGKQQKSGRFFRVGTLCDRLHLDGTQTCVHVVVPRILL